jgi:hypothetical protein
MLQDLLFNLDHAMGLAVNSLMFALYNRALGKTFQGYISGRGALQFNLPYSFVKISLVIKTI